MCIRDRDIPGGFEAEDVPDTGVLAAFLERVSLVADTDEIPENTAGVVTLMTLHTAKGLEFPVVFVTGWEDGMFPHMRALDDPSELSEERPVSYTHLNALDFDDLIGETVAVLQAFPEIAGYYRRRFRYVLVDEYQDTNHAQYVLCLLYTSRCV